VKAYCININIAINSSFAILLIPAKQQIDHQRKPKCKAVLLSLNNQKIEGNAYEVVILKWTYTFYLKAVKFHQPFPDF
jgi:hypothetical protein